MQDEQKKIAVLAALFAVMLAVGAFQFRSMGGPAQNTSTKASPSKHAVPVKDSTPAGAVALTPLAERDPFDIPAKSPQPSFKPDPVVSSSTAGTNEAKSISGAFPMLPTSTSQLVRDPLDPKAKAAEAKPEPTFGWAVTGVLIGAHPLAVFADSTGNQRLIQVGQAIDPDSKLVSVTKQFATVAFRGKSLQLNVGGNPNAK